jgi:hypothetical protein
MHFFVGLTIKSRFPKPKIGKFFRSSAHGGNYVWRRETTSDIAKLAELVNEASDFLRTNNNPHLLLRVITCDAPAEAVPEAPQEDALPPQVEPDPAGGEKRPRLLRRAKTENPFA